MTSNLKTEKEGHVLKGKSQVGGFGFCGGATPVGHGKTATKNESSLKNRQMQHKKAERDSRGKSRESKKQSGGGDQFGAVVQQRRKNVRGWDSKDRIREVEKTIFNVRRNRSSNKSGFRVYAADSQKKEKRGLFVKGIRRREQESFVPPTGEETPRQPGKKHCSGERLKTKKKRTGKKRGIKKS